ncbi:hypothetical protein SPSINT_2265 [Staphylococcus pseudintermedius HKU10-03]|nr:hypothetical protein SPSINT_2265 [Staphylococcus pseudintermedius HKU10-03]ADX75548.1 hypothetical protein SPSE_0202 [Staphylococcus pseudintermedius ED99]
MKGKIMAVEQLHLPYEVSLFKSIHFNLPYHEFPFILCDV